MRPNRLKQLWAAGEAAINGWLHIPSHWSAEVMAHQGFDSLTVDLQHGQLDFQGALAMLTAISTTDVVPLVRAPWNEPGIIMRLLDAGAYGVICPMVNSRLECEQFVGACRYFPSGYRSYGPTRARLYGGADYAAGANETVIAMAMIETAVAVENVDDIVGVEGLDAIYIGPGDLCVTLGLAGRVDVEEPPYLDALDTILAACRAHGVVAGIHTADPAYARRMIARGFQFVTLSSDTGLLATQARRAVTAVREGAAEARGPDSPY